MKTNPIYLFLNILIIAQMGKVALCAGYMSYYDSFAAKGLIWTKMATICMRRDVIFDYKVKYNSNRGCCPKLLLYSDEQYQRIVFLKALEILKEKEIAKKTGRHETEVPISNPVVIRLANPSASSFGTGRGRRSTRPALAFLRLLHNSSRMAILRDIYKHKEKHSSKFDINSKRNADFLNKVANRELGKQILRLPSKQYRRKRSVVKQVTGITYSDVIKELYFESTVLMEEAEKRVREVRSCNQAQKELTQVLDKTQIIQLCPKSGISIDPRARASKICGGTVRPSSKVFLPNLTETQSWYGYSEKTGGNKNFGYWQDNTWHIALLNCPGTPPLNITYVIDFDVQQNVGKTTSNPNYINPMLKRVCERTVLPVYSTQDGILYGSGAYLDQSFQINIVLILCITYCFIY